MNIGRLYMKGMDKQMQQLDNRGLKPPEPMVRTLHALEKIKNGDTLMIINDRRPLFLYEELDALGYPHVTEQNEDGSYKITIMKQGD